MTVDAILAHLASLLSTLRLPPMSTDLIELILARWGYHTAPGTPDDPMMCALNTVCTHELNPR